MVYLDTSALLELTGTATRDALMTDLQAPV